jgi:hypothetical protein
MARNIDGFLDQAIYPDTLSWLKRLDANVDPIDDSPASEQCKVENRIDGTATFEPSLATRDL